LISQDDFDGIRNQIHNRINQIDEEGEDDDDDSGRRRARES